MNYLLLFLPFVLSAAMGGRPDARYFIAWSGSFLILWMSLTGRVTTLPGGLPLRHHLLRPFVFTQVVFAGYTALSSIFYYTLATGGNAPPPVVGLAAPSRELAAEAQMYYVLAHASVTTGMLLFASYRDSGKYQIRTGESIEVFFLRVALAAALVMMLVAMLPGLHELQLRLRSFALTASICSFALSIIRRKRGLLLANAGIFGYNALLALQSGWKEQLVILVAWLGVLVFPYYRRATTLLMSVAVVLFVILLPAYTAMYRALAWAYQVEPSTAMRIAYRELRSGNVNIETAATGFLVGRVSEISLFVGYLDQVPRLRPFYGTAIVEQTAMTFVPRIMWPEKPNLETVVMERAYENEIVSRASRISAKPGYVVDSYLSAGAIGIFLACLVYGMLATLTSRLAERWFGGYLIGNGLMHAAFFQIFWRGNSYEFLFPTVFWSVMVMVALFTLGRAFGYIVLSSRTVSVARGAAPRVQSRPSQA